MSALLLCLLLTASTAFARPVAEDVQPSHSNMVKGCHVVVHNKIVNSTIAVVAVTNQDEVSGGPTFLKHEQTAHFERPWKRSTEPDIRVRVFTTRSTPQGLVLGEMRQVYTCYNPLIGKPLFGVAARPFERNGKKYNSYQTAPFIETQGRHMDDFDQGTYVHRHHDLPGHVKFTAEVHRMSPWKTEDFPTA